MRMSLENIGRRLSRTPMLKALVPLVAGIVVAGRWSLPLWGAAAGLVVCVAAGVVWRHRARADLFIAAAMFFAGWCAAQMRPAVQAPQGERVMELTVDEVLTRRDGVTLAEGRIVAFASGRDVERCGAVVRIWADGSLPLCEGERLEALCRVRPFADNGYGRYMLRQGVAGSVSLDSMRVIRRTETPLRWARRLHHKAVERISQLGLDTPTQAVVAAMAVGDRSGLTPELRDRYARSGTSHLLAVSGLHVGFVFIIVNLLLMWMLTLWYGYAVRCLVVVAAIWVYAAVTGFSPSVVRAAVMFSVFQVSMALTVRFDSLNSLCLTACIMLLADARSLTDAGFRLSFLSVAAILEWGLPIYRATTRPEILMAFVPYRSVGHEIRYIALRTVRVAARWVWCGVIMGAVASVVTAPLVSYLFGTVSLWSVVAGPASVLLSGITVGAAMVWVLFPLPLLQPVAAWVTARAATSMEALVEACAGNDAMIWEGYVPASAAAWAYVAMAAFTLWLWSVRDRKRRRRRRRK